ncbi:hypothetical protein BD626DRAFT_472258 [Schizophyllum amplum]|uniref:Uncharacterized protein n=1 Tax=Schizophyllum amplum TaxID=97359 RepID=A0A550CVR9_9AGAR|nr:hypothetical protein BD626DRAFT_472258 [Auriculariopsis ampla]
MPPELFIRPSCTSEPSTAPLPHTSTSGATRSSRNGTGNDTGVADEGAISEGRLSLPGFCSSAHSC